MGKGDKKTRRGKISMGSYGISRPRKKKKNSAPKTATTEKTAKKATTKKAAPKKAAKAKGE